MKKAAIIRIVLFFLNLAAMVLIDRYLRTSSPPFLDATIFLSNLLMVAYMVVISLILNRPGPAQDQAQQDRSRSQAAASAKIQDETKPAAGIGAAKGKEAASRRLKVVRWSSSTEVAYQEERRRRSLQIAIWLGAVFCLVFIFSGL